MDFLEKIKLTKSYLIQERHKQTNDSTNSTIQIRGSELQCVFGIHDSCGMGRGSDNREV